MERTISKLKIELTLPEPVYEFLLKAMKEPQKFLQQIFESSLRSFFEYCWGDRYSDVSSLLREFAQEPEVRAGFKAMSESEILQKIQAAQA